MTRPPYLWECNECGSPNVRALPGSSNRPRRTGAGVLRVRKCVDCGTFLRTVELPLMVAAPILPRFSAS